MQQNVERIARWARGATAALFGDRCAVCERGGVSAVLCQDCVARLIPHALPRCPRCSRPVNDPGDVCPECCAFESEAGRTWHFERATAPFLFDAAARRIVLAYKFGPRPALADTMAHILAQWYRADGLDGVVVPAPSSPKARARRGFDHMARVAAKMQRGYGLSVFAPFTRMAGSAQKELDRAERLTNLSRQICIDTRTKMPPSVVLIDDVMTTGATADHCCALLRQAGAKRCAVLVFAVRP